MCMRVNTLCAIHNVKLNFVSFHPSSPHCPRHCLHLACHSVKTIPTKAGSSASHRSDYRGRSRSRSPSSSSSSSRSPSPQRRRDQHDQRRDQRPGSTATAKATSAAARQPPTSSSFTVRSPAGKSFGIGKMPAPSSKVLVSVQPTEPFNRRRAHTEQHSIIICIVRSSSRCK